MVTPNKTEIYALAKQKYLEHAVKNGIEPIEPEPEELRENGFVKLAVSELMRNNTRAQVEEWQEYSNQVDDFGKIDENEKDFEVDIEELVRSGLFIAGGKGTTKSNLAMFIADKLIKENIIVKVFDISQSWQKRSSVPNLVEVNSNSQLKIDLHQSTVFDLSRLTPQASKEFISKLLEVEWNFQIDIAEEERKTIIYVFEEVQLLVPQGSLRSNEAQYVLRLMTTGRNFKLGYIGITQRPALTDTSVFELSFQRYFARMDGQNDLKKVASYIGTEKARQLQNLKLGQFFYDRGSETKLIKTAKFETEVKPSKLWQAEPTVKTEPKEQAEPKEPDWLKLAQIGFQIGSLLVFLFMLALAVSSW